MLSILPTDTCYGLAGELTSTDYAEIYRLKGRDFAKPLAILIESYDDMHNYVEISSEQIEFLRKYPRPWSYLSKRNSQWQMPSFLDNAQYTKIALRVAESCIPTMIRTEIIYPLFLTSANTSGSSESKTLTEAREYFPSIAGIDGGICDLPPSDIVYWEGEELMWIRKH